MNRKSVVLWLMVGVIAILQWSHTPAGEVPKPEIVSLSDIEAAAASFKGQIQATSIEEEEAPKEALFQQYGTRIFATFKKHPDLVVALRKLNPKFNPRTMGTSDLNTIVRTDGRTFLILVGCFPHNCGGTHQVVAVDPATKRVYLLQPTNVGPDTTPTGKFYLYGDPDSSVRAAMCNAYPR